nr:MAG TPA: hypothetical protein [Caudoviricetes sp.]DAX55991.1 MAG TPA: hypothetical protein [Caudoviricetes sp.]
MIYPLILASLIPNLAAKTVFFPPARRFTKCSILS